MSDRLCCPGSEDISKLNGDVIHLTDVVNQLVNEVQQLRDFARNEAHNRSLFETAVLRALSVDNFIFNDGDEEAMRSIDMEKVVSCGGNKSGVEANMKDIKEADVGGGGEENKFDSGGNEVEEVGEIGRASASLKDDIGQPIEENERKVYTISTSSSLRYDGLFREANAVDFTYVMKDLSSPPVEYCREKDPINVLNSYSADVSGISSLSRLRSNFEFYLFQCSLLLFNSLLIKNEQASYNSQGNEDSSRVAKITVKAAGNSNCEVTSMSRVVKENLGSNSNGSWKSIQSLSSECVEICGAEFANVKVHTKNNSYYHFDLISYLACYK